MAAKKTVKIEATDTFRGTMGVKVSTDSDVVWAGYVFPMLNPDSGSVEWAVDSYVGTQELDYFLKDLKARNGFEKKSPALAKAVLGFLGAPTFDVPALVDSLGETEVAL